MGLQAVGHKPLYRRSRNGGWQCGRARARPGAGPGGYNKFFLAVISAACATACEEPPTRTACRKRSVVLPFASSAGFAGNSPASSGTQEVAIKYGHTPPGCTRTVSRLQYRHEHPCPRRHPPRPPVPDHGRFHAGAGLQRLDGRRRRFDRHGPAAGHLLEAEPIAEIDPEPFYIYNFPGSMEVAALFRPVGRDRGGLIKSCDMPSNRSTSTSRRRLVLFVGKEPNMPGGPSATASSGWRAEMGVRRILFVGSFGGSVPHTREPRLFVSCSDPAPVAGDGAATA